MIRLSVSRLSDETWREAVKRIAGKQGLESECLETFDDYVTAGDDEDRAAFDALYDWDCFCELSS